MSKQSILVLAILSALGGAAMAYDTPIGKWEGTLDSNNYPNGGTLSNWIFENNGTTEGDWTMDIGGGITVSSHAVGSYTYVGGVLTATYADCIATESGYGTTNYYDMSLFNGEIPGCDSARGQYTITFDPKTGWPSSDSGTWDVNRISDPCEATNPSPSDGAGGQPMDVNLSWSNAGGACAFDVYFGTNFDEVNDANNPHISSGRGNWPEAKYEPELLSCNRTYYWRIDADNGNGATKGQTWHFRTGIPDLNGDGKVCFKDLRIFVSYWLDDTCAGPNWCAQTDFNRSYSTDFADFDMLAQCWCADTSLVGHWTMDDDEPNTTVVDSSGYGNHGTAQRNTSVLHSTGTIDGALTFNGSSDYIDCGNDISLALTKWTMSAWVYRNVDSGNHERIIAKSNSMQWDYRIQVKKNNDGIAAGFADTGGNIRYTYTTEAVSTGIWHHVVSTWDGTYVKIYINGTLKQTSADFSPYIPRTSAVPLNIGRLGNDGWRYDFTGKLDDVMIFKRALSGQEIEALYSL